MGTYYLYGHQVLAYVVQHVAELGHFADALLSCKLDLKRRPHAPLAWYVGDHALTKALFELLDQLLDQPLVALVAIAEPFLNLLQLLVAYGPSWLPRPSSTSTAPRHGWQSRCAGCLQGSKNKKEYVAVDVASDVAYSSLPPPYNLWYHIRAAMTSRCLQLLTDT